MTQPADMKTVAEFMPDWRWDEDHQRPYTSKEYDDGSVIDWLLYPDTNRNHLQLVIEAMPPEVHARYWDMRAQITKDLEKDGDSWFKLMDTLPCATLLECAAAAIRGE